MTTIALHLETPPQRPPATATLSAPAMASRANTDYQTNDFQTDDYPTND